MADHWYHGINWTRAERVWEEIMRDRREAEMIDAWFARGPITHPEPLYPTAAEYIACLTTDYAPKKQFAGTATMPWNNVYAAGWGS